MNKESSLLPLNIIELPYLNSDEVFDSLAGEPWAIFLDSGVLTPLSAELTSADVEPSCDVLAITPHTTIVFEQGESVLSKNGEVTRLKGDPLALLQAQMPEFEIPDELTQGTSLPRYLPGAFGYFSYDLARQYESLPAVAHNDEQLPEMAVGLYDVIVLVNHALRKTQLLQLGNTPQSSTVVEQWLTLFDSLKNNTKKARQASFAGRLYSQELLENMDYAHYSDRFDRVRNYTIEGDCYQVNLAKRFSAKVNGDAWQTYRYLRHHSPAPYGAYLKLPFACVLSNSPESFIQCRNRSVVTSPIKGTRPRDHDDAQRDAEIANELRNSEKDRAENLMIVDLMRNDLSKCCELGSVKVPSLFALHSFANVHHLISTITGTLKKELHALDLLRSCFPGGSITGAPKIRAMEIIEELEPHRRGLYCGSIAYIGADGSLETNIAIRTIVIRESVARYSAGGGLVIDSDLDEEYQEVIDKARMMVNALTN